MKLKYVIIFSNSFLVKFFTWLIGSRIIIDAKIPRKSHLVVAGCKISSVSILKKNLSALGQGKICYIVMTLYFYLYFIGSSVGFNNIY